MRSEMEFNFDSDSLLGKLTAAQATQLVAHLPLTPDRLTIRNAAFGPEFMEALIERVRKFHYLKDLRLWDTVVGEEELGGKDAGLRLADVLTTNTTIKTLRLIRSDLIGKHNVEQWGNALMENNTLIWLGLPGVGRDSIEQLNMKTKG